MCECVCVCVCVKRKREKNFFMYVRDCVCACVYLYVRVCARKREIERLGKGFLRERVFVCVRGYACVSVGLRVCVCVCVYLSEPSYDSYFQVTFS